MARADSRAGMRTCSLDYGRLSDDHISADRHHLSGSSVRAGRDVRIDAYRRSRVAHQAGLDVWNFAEAQERLRATNEESARLRDEVEQLRESIEAAEHLTSRLIKGEVTLAHATASIEPLMLERRGFRSSASISYPAPTFRLMVARYLIDHARRTLQSDPSRLAGLEVQLRAEYEGMK